MINSSLDVPCVVVSFKTMNDSCIHWLYMSSEIRPKVFDLDICKTFKTNMTSKIVLEQKNVTISKL